jgi:hypothetical protein
MGRVLRRVGVHADHQGGGGKNESR